MKPIHFKQVTKTLQKPNDMPDEQCEPLPVASDGVVSVSCWTPTLRERLSILVFGRIWLFVYSGSTHPPVSLLAQKDVFSNQEEQNEND